jgi:hypothetical protein
LVTQGTRNKAVLDKIFTDIDQWYEPAEVMAHLGRSDHNCIRLMSLNRSNSYKPERHYVTTRCASRYNRFMLGEKLKDINWIDLYRTTNVSAKLNLFNNTVTRLIDESMPLKVVQRNNNDKKWVTDHYRELIISRQNAYLRGDQDEYKRLHNIVNNKTKNSRNSIIRRT